jgi:DNA transformation protein
MPVSDGFAAFVLEQLAPIAPVTAKRMFGGVGLYAGDLFFALLMGDVVYLKADESTRRSRETAGARPFEPYPGQGRGTMQYYSVPVSILEDRDELTAWATQSIAIARAQRGSPPPRRKQAGSTTSKRPTKRLKRTPWER